LDPCTCTTTQKACGSRLKLVREPDHIETHHSLPPTVQRNAYGAYVDAGSLTGAAAEAARKGAAVVGGGAGALAPGAATYETDAAGRVFLEGAQIQRDVTTTVTQIVPVTEVERVPYTVVKMVSEEVVRQVPTKVTRMVPTIVQKTVPVTTCR